MKYKITVQRQKSSDSPPYYEQLEFKTEYENETVATMLEKLNSGREDEIKWDCNCLQKKCGACAMVINGKPRLACDTKLNMFKDKRITLEPLKKFPTVCDLVVDRSAMMENLKTLSVWLEDNAEHSERRADIAYEASRCLQCGCCLDVCPNFMIDGKFFSAAAVVPISRIIAELAGKKKYEILSNYRTKLYNGCGKSLSCMNVCPVGLDVQRLLVNSNAAAIWKRFIK